MNGFRGGKIPPKNKYSKIQQMQFKWYAEQIDKEKIKMNKNELTENLLREIIWVCFEKYKDKEITEEMLKDAFRELKCFGIKAKAILGED